MNTFRYCYPREGAQYGRFPYMTGSRASERDRAYWVQAAQYCAAQVADQATMARRCQIAGLVDDAVQFRRNAASWDARRVDALAAMVRMPRTEGENNG